MSTTYLASHEQAGNELFSHLDDARRWVESQADYYEQKIDRWVTFSNSESLRLADGRTYAGTVRSMVVDERAEHRQYEAEQQAEAQEAEAAEADRRTLTADEYSSAWHAVEGAAGEPGADPATILHAVLDRLGIATPAAVEHPALSTP